MARRVPERSELLTWPNALSISRVLLVAPLAWSLINAHGVLSLVLFAVVLASDFFDGHLARRTGHASALGTLVDHASDATFVAVTGIVLARLGLIPWLLPGLIVVAFLQYLLDSRAHVGAPLRRSRLGRWNGIGYFVITGAAIAVHHFEPSPPAVPVLHVLGWLLCGTTVASLVDRGLHRARA